MGIQDRVGSMLGIALLIEAGRLPSKSKPIIVRVRPCPTAAFPIAASLY